MRPLKMIDSAHIKQYPFEQAAYAMGQIGLSLKLFAREARRQKSIHITVRPHFNIQWSGREYMEREQERLNGLITE